jgi:hypothetical protein
LIEEVLCQNNGKETKNRKRKELFLMKPRNKRKRKTRNGMMGWSESCLVV